MGRVKRRTRVTAKTGASSTITCKPHEEIKNGVVYSSWRVQGWQEDGKWKRKQFKTQADAERFVALKRIEVENEGIAQRMVLSPLDDSQLEEAKQAFDALGGTYKLSEAVSYFLKHHRAPDYEIRLEDALKRYLEAKEKEGTRPRTLAAIKSVVTQFIVASDYPWTHEVNSTHALSFLEGLRSKDGETRATRKTWNNYRNDLHAFFSWCGEEEKATNRPYIFNNPLETVRKYTGAQVREEQSSKPNTTPAQELERLLCVLLRWKEGALLRYYALAYFAGIRPEELKRLSDREDELINLETRTINIPANISKTRHERNVTISENLAAWLEIAPKPIIPANFDKLSKKIRKHFALTHDEPRHSFISFHVAVNHSVGKAALEAGNSESIVKKHYLRLHTFEQGEHFWSLVPSPQGRGVTRLEKDENSTPWLKAV